LMAVQGLFIAFCSLVAFTYVLFVEKEGVGRARTAAFIVLAVAQLFQALNSRHQMKSIFELGFFTNLKLIYALLISLVLQLSVVYVPFMQKIFKTENLTLFDWVLVIVLSSLPFWTMELVKLLNKKFKIYEIY